MQVAETYVQHLLNSADALGAVTDLAAIWSARPNRSEAQPHFGLAAPEFNVHLSLAYTGEVMNGGHSQFFMNRFGRFTPETASALRVVGLFELAAILESASSIFGDPAMIRDDDHRDAVLRSLTTEQASRLQGADAAFNEAFSKTHTACLAYLREHGGEILRPERSV